MFPKAQVTSNKMKNKKRLIFHALVCGVGKFCSEILNRPYRKILN